MGNAIPLLEGTDASGGYLVPDEIGRTLQHTIQRDSAVADLSRVERLAGKRTQYPVYAGRPTAAFVAEGGPKVATGAEFTETTLNVKKIATTVIYTEELLEDAREDPRTLVNADVEAAVANLIDAHALGYQSGSAIVGQFDSELTSTSQTTEVALSGAGLATAVSAAMTTIESNGGTPNGIILTSSGRGPSA
jgi:HK97 family phage major capsid protein